ncbi:peptidyl-prolyl cis-trans isomerase FKBP8-like [Hypanus sabinus]|uniref:peptidyl-prolyl cis-trans isomerase FKBP8-like n=1 Tax=Hypanus sabinus TaxID=79690 RepID=UPI0028C407C0|nr:peptidyl-prolyl cis-trans isomerase FKBP8-like [Hypanus sabinus]
MDSPPDGVDSSQEWIDVLGNGLLIKKILKCGDAQLDRPGIGEDVKIWVKIMQENGEVILGRQKMSFTINSRDVIKALEICVPLMCIHETALILTDSTFCSGRASSSEASEVKPGSRVLLEVELLSVSRTCLEVTPKAEQLQMIGEKRQEGNQYFQRKNYKMAILCYTSALAIIDTNTKDILNHEDKKSLLDEKVKCYSNLAACHLNTGQLEEAFTCCDIVLQHQPQHCKALFRKGKVLELQEQYFLSIKFLRKALQVEPANQEIERAMKLVFDKWAAKSEGTSNAKMVNECSLFLADESKVKPAENHSEMPEECQRT